jgi:CheY-like chemotaxis protein
LARKILLADDSVTAQNMGRKILADAGYDVITVNNGSAALKRIAETSPDLIILDVYMPGYSGLEVCQKLKEAAETADIPVLLSVGKLEPFKPQEARRVRADAHIVKPFEASQLLTAIARLEDAMVPQQHKSRFATSGAASDESFGNQEESRILGRGAKLSGLRRREASATDAGNGSGPASFRDFRKNKAKSPTPVTGADLESDAPEPSQEPGPLAKLPRDITPEELSALSEVAAQLTGTAPAESSFTSSPGFTSKEISPEATDSEAEATLVVAKATATSIPFSTVTAREPAAAAVPETAQAVSAESTESSTPALESDAAKNVVEIPVAQLEPAAEPATGTTGGGQTVGAVSQPVASSTIESRQDSDFQAPQAATAASFAEEPAPIDQQEEPMFASAAAEEMTPEQPGAYASSSTAEAVAQVTLEEAKAEESSSRDSSGLDSSSNVSSSLDSSFAQTVVAESTSSESISAESTAAEFCAIEASIADPITTQRPAAAVQTTEETTSDAPMPSEAELAEALRLLMPATAAAEAPSSEATPEPEKVSVAAQVSANDAIEAAAGTRWVAEALALTPEEAALSLEAEMFRAFAASAEKIDSLPSENPMLAIQSAVENRLAQEMAAQELAATEAAPKAMAAAAPTGQGADSTDESDIASIVEKVMADLRPRIVEEIARKLANKS